MPNKLLSFKSSDGLYIFFSMAMIMRGIVEEQLWCRLGRAYELNQIGSWHIIRTKTLCLKLNTYPFQLARLCSTRANRGVHGNVSYSSQPGTSTGLSSLPTGKPTGQSSLYTRKPIELSSKLRGTPTGLSSFKVNRDTPKAFFTATRNTQNAFLRPGCTACKQRWCFRC